MSGPAAPRFDSGRARRSSSRNGLTRRPLVSGYASAVRWRARRRRCHPGDRIEMRGIGEERVARRFGCLVLLSEQHGHPWPVVAAGSSGEWRPRRECRLGDDPAAARLCCFERPLRSRASTISPSSRRTTASPVESAIRTFGTMDIVSDRPTVRSTIRWLRTPSWSDRGVRRCQPSAELQLSLRPENRARSRVRNWGRSTTTCPVAATTQPC